MYNIHEKPAHKLKKKNERKIYHTSNLLYLASRSRLRDYQQDNLRYLTLQLEVCVVGRTKYSLKVGIAA